MSQNLSSAAVVTCALRVKVHRCHAENPLPNLCLVVNLQHSSCKHAFLIRMEDSVDPDWMASSEASQSGSTVFSKKG